MNKDDLKKLGIEDDDLIQKIIVEHGKTIEKHKTDLATAKTELDGLKTQLTEANQAIEGFKKMDVEGVQKAADEWKAKAEAAEQAATEQITKLKFDHALDGALTGAKAKNLKAVKALLDLEGLKLNDDGTVEHLDERLKKIQSENDYLFEVDGPGIKLTSGTNKKSVLGDQMVIAARKAAGLDPAEE